MIKALGLHVANPTVNIGATYGLLITAKNTYKLRAWVRCKHNPEYRLV